MVGSVAEPKQHVFAINLANRCYQAFASDRVVKSILISPGAGWDEK